MINNRYRKPAGRFVKKVRRALCALALAAGISGCGLLEPLEPPEFVDYAGGKYAVFDERWLALLDDIYENGFQRNGNREYPAIGKEAAYKNFEKLKGRIDKAYEILKDFTGGEPSASQKIFITIEPDSHFDAEVTAAHAHTDTALICVKQDAAVNELYIHVLNGNWSMILVHELGHLFDKIRFDEESAANLMAAYVQGKLNINYVNYATGDSKEFYFKNSRAAYENGEFTTFSHGSSIEYTAYTMYSFGLQKHVGWEPLRRAFRGLNVISSQSREARAVKFYERAALEARHMEVFKLLPDNGRLFADLKKSAELGKTQTRQDKHIIND